MRGKLMSEMASEIAERIIPAHAGQTRRWVFFPTSRTDHPRACGANMVQGGRRHQQPGSSPRMRGKQERRAQLVALGRIIPAHAGQTNRAVPRSLQGSDHPRACGANSVQGDKGTFKTGSSPRMRGKRFHLILDLTFLRIIPAHAGQTHTHRKHWNADPDHPRACGANFGVGAIIFHPFGSSPRMRGKLSGFVRVHRSKRIIPAHAGQTVRFYAKTLERWTLNNWIRTVAPIFVLLFLPPVIGQNAYIERHYSNQSFSWFSKLHYASAFDLSLVA